MTRFPSLLLPFVIAGCAAGAAQMPDPKEMRAQVEAFNRQQGRAAAADPAVVVEGTVEMTVDEVAETAEAVAAAAVERGGKVSELTLEAWGGRVVVRLPPDEVDGFIEAISPLGTVTARSITATDQSEAVVDLRLRLENLERAMARYQAILEQASTVEEALKVEAELTRLRGEIERTKAEQQRLADRVALARITVELTPSYGEESPDPQPKLYPGLRLSHLVRYRSDARPRVFAGPGLSLFGSRVAHLDFDLLADLSGPMDRVDALLVSFGGDFYSDFLGRGRRRWLNPHMGYAVGYGWIERQHAFTFSLAAGVEVFKTAQVLVDTGVRLVGVFGAPGPALGVESTLSLHLAF